VPCRSAQRQLRFASQNHRPASSKAALVFTGSKSTNHARKIARASRSSVRLVRRFDSILSSNAPSTSAMARCSTRGGSGKVTERSCPRLKPGTELSPQRFLRGLFCQRNRHSPRTVPCDLYAECSRIGGRIQRAARAETGWMATARRSSRPLRLRVFARCPFFRDISTGLWCPAGLKQFVKSARQAGLGVILAVVYNHFGPGDLDT
jgi:hypothetical protein